MAWEFMTESGEPEVEHFFRGGFRRGGFGGFRRGFGRIGRFGRVGRFGRFGRFGRLGRFGGGFGDATAQLIPWAQSCLAQLLGPWVIQDGHMGPNTSQAIQQFQQQQQLPATGVLDPNTVSALQAACSGQQAGGDAGAGGSQPAPPGEMGEYEYESSQPGRTGRWVRRHGRIVLLGV